MTARIDVLAVLDEAQDWLYRSSEGPDSDTRAANVKQARAVVADLIVQTAALKSSIEALMQMDVRGHKLQDRLQFSESGRAIATQVSAAIAGSSCSTEWVMALIESERNWQKQAHGYTTSHDDEHADGALACAAAWYALPPTFMGLNAKFEPHNLCQISAIYPRGWERPSNGSRERELIKSAALIVAELERLRRANQNAKGGAA